VLDALRRNLNPPLYRFVHVALTLRCIGAFRQHGKQSIMFALLSRLVYILHSVVMGHSKGGSDALCPADIVELRLHSPCSFIAQVLGPREQRIHRTQLKEATVPNMIGSLSAAAQETRLAEDYRRFNVDFSAVFSADPYPRR